MCFAVYLVQPVWSLFNPYGVTVFSTLLQYSSLLLGSDPFVLSIRVILQSLRNRDDHLKMLKNAQKQMAAYAPPLFLFSDYFPCSYST